MSVAGLYSKDLLDDRMGVAVGGRLPEEIINGKDNVTTGADQMDCLRVFLKILVSEYWRPYHMDVMNMLICSLTGLPSVGGKNSVKSNEGARIMCTRVF